MSISPPANQDLQIKEAFTGGRWNLHLFANELSQNDLDRVLRTEISYVPTKDFLVWDGNVNGDFSVASAFGVLRQRRDSRL